MLHWLIDTDTAHPQLAAGIPPDGLLSPGEYTRFLALRTVKRRQDWLLGRWTAKHLIQQVIDPSLPLDSIAIANRPSGVAYLPGYPALHLSISHSSGWAFCAVADHPIGVDVERIEPRIPEFAVDYFTFDECVLVEQCDQPDTLITAIWSAKEAGLKTLGLGLRADTRSLVCVGTMPNTDWTNFQLIPDAHYLNADPLYGWWRVMDSFVLTLVTPVPL